MIEQLKGYWVKRWDYITFTDAVNEAKKAGLVTTIKEYKEAYKQMEYELEWV